MKNLTKLFIVTLASIILMAACGSNNSEKSSEAKKDNETVKIEHAMGTTEIKGKPKRVVTLYQGATDVSVALGVKPVGAVESWVQQPKYDYIKDDLKRSEEHTSELQSRFDVVCRLLLEKKNHGAC